MQTLETEQLICRVNPMGAELHSLQLKANPDELIWQGNPAVWSGRAPILFPIVGALKHTPSNHAKGSIQLDKHGFARKSLFELVDKGQSVAEYCLQSNHETLAQYPWKFRLTVRFELTADRLAIRYRVHNQDDCDMLFNIGSHPAFRLPMGGSNLSDYSIQFDQPEQLAVYSVSEGGLLERTPTDYPITKNLITLSERIFDNDALVFKNIKSTRITLQHRRLGNRLSVDTGGAPHLGLWAKPGAEFVCIEPWWGHADFSNASKLFAEKTSIQFLPANQHFATRIEIQPSVSD